MYSNEDDDRLKVMLLIEEYGKGSMHSGQRNGLTSR